MPNVNLSPELDACLQLVDVLQEYLDTKGQVVDVLETLCNGFYVLVSPYLIISPDLGRQGDTKLIVSPSKFSPLVSSDAEAYLLRFVQARSD